MISKTKSIVISCFLAGYLEIYEFVIFGFLKDILHKNYFQFLSEDKALLVTYVLFSIGFVVRPIGALVFGYIGDKFGRKKALVTSVLLMGTASLIMFMLPTYQTIGVSACYIIAIVNYRNS